MLKSVIEKLIDRQNLSFQEASSALTLILSGADSHQAAAFLALMRAKGETIEELQGIVAAMRQCMVPVRTTGPVLDIVGTGGDGAHTVNISTGSAILAASCGVPIAKHGNRSVSSLCGSADVLEALGIRLPESASEVERSIQEVGIGFMFAPHFHPAMKQIREVRQGLKIRTCFNLIGPLLNPASAEHLMIGVAHADLLETMASVISTPKRRRSFVFHGAGLDELSCIGPTQVIEIDGSHMRRLMITPQELGLKSCTVEDLRGQDAQTNAALLLRAFSGEEGAIADTLALNAAAALYLYGIAPSLAEGLVIAQNSLKEQRALKLLNAWRDHVS